MNRSRYVGFGTLRPGLRVDLYPLGADPMHHPDEIPVYESVLVTSEPEKSRGRTFVRVQVGNDFSSIRIWEDEDLGSEQGVSAKQAPCLSALNRLVDHVPTVAH